MEIKTEARAGSTFPREILVTPAALQKLAENIFQAVSKEQLPCSHFRCALPQVPRLFHPEKQLPRLERLGKKPLSSILNSFPRKTL